MSVFSGGIELSWGEHIANNIYVSLFLGYRPSPLNTYSLIIVDRSSMFESFNDLAFTVGDFFSYLGQSLSFVMKFGFFESFFRPVYAVKPVEYYQVKFRELKGKKEENIIYKKKGLLKSIGLFSGKSMNIFSKRGSSFLTYPASFLGRMSSIFGSG